MKRHAPDLQELVLKGDSLRKAKCGRPSESGDGVWWSSQQRLAMVADGIGGLKVGDEEWGGDGTQDIAHFQDALKGPRELTRHRVREAFFSVAGKKRESAVILLYFMRYLHEKALILQAGDCSVVRVNRQTRERSLEVLVTPQNIWDEHFVDFVFPQLKNIHHPSELSRYSLEALKILVDALLEHFRKLPYADFYESKISHITFWIRQDRAPDVHKYRECLWRLISYIRSCQTCSWRASPNRIQEKIGDGVLVEVKKSDRFVLCSDGIFPGVVNETEMIDVLLAHDRRDRAARELFRLAEKPGRKQDDRAVVIIDVDTRPARKR